MLQKQLGRAWLIREPQELKTARTQLRARSCVAGVIAAKNKHCDDFFVRYSACPFPSARLPVRTQMAGLGYSLDFTTRGLRLSFGGFGDKMPDFISKVAEAVATFTPSDPVEFERLRDVVGFYTWVWHFWGCLLYTSPSPRDS